MLRIGLARIGKKKQAYFRVVVQEKQRDPFGSTVETVGSINPHTNPSTVILKEDRVKHWLSVGAQPTAQVHNLLVDRGLLTTKKVRTAKADKPTEAPPAAVATPAAPEAPQAEEKPTEQPAA
ncbi:MAG: 30S ribosomal protein S16 [bacterium]|nr:30S ribosomal protein S16 [bacterium]